MPNGLASDPQPADAEVPAGGPASGGALEWETWQELSALAEERLKAMLSAERGVFAAGIAQRLMSWHEALPEDERAPFTLSLRPLLHSVWEGVLGDSAAFSAVKCGVGECILSEYCHNDGQGGPDDADESAAAATLYAAHALPVHLPGIRRLEQPLGS
ncbi:hypothetical protein AB0932_29345 [Streptomyces sp. NPDC006682]|uniref:hypothetical protein n=1 Tax=unclassified Streptomyces TaxID=2593676 RepID=UPI0034524457